LCGRKSRSVSKSISVRLFPRSATSKASGYRLNFIRQISNRFLQMKGWFTDRTADAIKVLERCVELDPESELAVLAGKELARLGRL
jgi:hypothetical protein